MKKLLLSAVGLISVIILTSCSTSSLIPSRDATVADGRPVEDKLINNATVGTNISAMDASDKNKMSHALDNPLGKSTCWTNSRTGVCYTVTPVSKLAYDGNPFCRRYTVVISKNDRSNQMGGVACVSATDSSWRIIN